MAEITRLCGYLPLAIGMLARQLHHHPAWTVEDLAADLAATRDRLAADARREPVGRRRVRPVLPGPRPGQQRLFRRLGLHPGADIDAYAAAALTAPTSPPARRDLDALYDHYLLTEPARGRYRLHDLIREHARTLAAADPADREPAPWTGCWITTPTPRRSPRRSLARRTRPARPQRSRAGRGSRPWTTAQGAGLGPV